MIIAGTGHRPEKLGGHRPIIAEQLVEFAKQHLSSIAPDAVISGMALGWAQALASAALDMGIALTAAVPFEGFDRRWPASSRRHLDTILDRAKEVVVVHPFAAPTVALNLRNEWMVDRADLMLALHDGSWGGTFNCLAYAKKKGVPARNLWSRWEAFALEVGI